MIAAQDFVDDQVQIKYSLYKISGFWDVSDFCRWLGVLQY